MKVGVRVAGIMCWLFILNREGAIRRWQSPHLESPLFRHRLSALIQRLTSCAEPPSIASIEFNALLGICRACRPSAVTKQDAIVAFVIAVLVCAL